MTAADTDTAGMTAVERAAVARYDAAIAALPCEEVDGAARAVAAMGTWLAAWWVEVDALDAEVHAPDRVPSAAASECVDFVIRAWFGARQQWLAVATEAFLVATAPPGRRPPGIPRPDIGGAVSTSTRPDAGALAYVPPS